MLPSRSRLERWNPDSLTHTGHAIETGGRTIDDAVTTMSNNIATMPETRAWSGDAHRAATTMFDRAQVQANALAAYTRDIGAVLRDGAGTIGAARTALLDKADEIDMNGQLYVSDQWVVLITGAAMTAEEAAALERRAQAEQVTVNALLLAVGAADDSTAAAVTAAATAHGFEPPDPTGLDNVTPGLQRPGDDVPNPAGAAGLMQQAMLRDIDMSRTIRDTRVDVDGDITTTTHTMQDGSKQVVTEDNEYQWDRGPTLRVTHYDNDGNFLSQTSTVTWKDTTTYSLRGATTTSTRLADGTLLERHQWPNGRDEAKVYTPDGREGDIPIEILSNPPTAIAGGALTGFERYVEQGGSVPRLSADALKGVGVGAKFAGPAVGVAEMLFNVAGAQSAFERCVDTYSGVGSVAGGFAPLLVPGAGWVTAGLISIGGSQVTSAFGTFLGNQFCSR
ncbi:WXG100 family type VII secretion target [Mycolicibacterium sp. S3B2]|uniref:WXG100 family type VII secretion target n=1 Tax=Mycolicibacterium sp. S3B2 TaxID=3415120 RepID=UPI003C79D058